MPSESGNDAGKGRKYDKLIRVLQFIPAALVLILSAASIILLFFMGVSAQDILSFEPSNPYIAAVVTVFAFAVKSLSVFFPIAALYVFSSLIFPLWAALLINLAGITVTLTVPYLVGKLSGREMVSRLVARFDKKGRAAEMMREKNIFYVSYMLRIISVLPADLVSMLFGSSDVSFKPYIAGSLAGSVPSMISITCMGATVTDPGSPEFIISTAVTVILAAGSMILHKVKQKKAAK